MNNLANTLSAVGSGRGDNAPTCARETLLQVQQETIQGLTEARKLASQIRDRLTGPYPEDGKKVSGCGPGAMGYAQESRSQVGSLCSELAEILQAL